MFTYKNAPYKIFALGPKFCWAGPIYIYIWNVELFDSRFDPQNFSPILSSILVLRALALKNANAISKGFLTFHGSKMSASKNCKPHYCKIFCNSATIQF